MYHNTYFALVHEYMDLRLNGFTHELALRKMYDIITHVEELQEDVYIELRRLAVEIDQYGSIKP